MSNSIDFSAPVAGYLKLTHHHCTDSMIKDGVEFQSRAFNQKQGKNSLNFVLSPKNFYFSFGREIFRELKFSINSKI